MGSLDGPEEAPDSLLEFAISCKIGSSVSQYVVGWVAPAYARRLSRTPPFQVSCLDRYAHAARARRLARHHRGGDEALLPRLCDERDRLTRPARRARRLETGPPAHPLRHDRGELRLEPSPPQVRARGGRRHGQVPPARRSGDLRRPCAHGPGLLDAAAADRRPGQLRLDGRRSPGGDALYRGAPGPVGRCAARGYRQGYRRFSDELRRHLTRARRFAGALPEPAGQRSRGNRGGHGDQHPAAQSWRGDRCVLRLYR